MRKASNPRYLQFTKQEAIVAFTTDRGQLRTNDNGEFFFRETPDGRFTCASPDLERRLVDVGYRAGEEVGITREPYGRSVIWKVRRIGEPVAEMPRQASTTKKLAARPSALPERVYATLEPAAESTAPRITATPSPVELNGGSETATQAAEAQPAAVVPAAVDSPTLIERCMIGAVNAAAKASTRAKELGFEVAFSGAEIERIAVTLYINAQNTLQAPERKPNGSAGSSYQNGAARRA